MKNFNEHFAINPLSKFSTAEQEDIAVKVALLTTAQASAGAKIIPVTPDVVLKKPVSLVATLNGDFAGFVTANTGVEHDGELLTKIGTLTVPSPFQKMGISGRLVNQITGRIVIEGAIPYAHVAKPAIGNFVETGFSLAEPWELPPGDTSPYGNLPLLHG